MVQRMRVPAHIAVGVEVEPKLRLPVRMAQRVVKEPQEVVVMEPVGEATPTVAEVSTWAMPSGPEIVTVEKKRGGRPPGAKNKPKGVS